VRPFFAGRVLLSALLTGRDRFGQMEKMAFPKTVCPNDDSTANRQIKRRKIRDFICPFCFFVEIREDMQKIYRRKT